MLFWSFPVAGFVLPAGLISVHCVERRDPWLVSQCRAFCIDHVNKQFHWLQLPDSISVLWKRLYCHWKKGLFLFGLIVLWHVHTFSFYHFIFLDWNTSLIPPPSASRISVCLASLTTCLFKVVCLSSYSLKSVLSSHWIAAACFPC